MKGKVKKNQSKKNQDLHLTHHPLQKQILQIKPNQKLNSIKNKVKIDRVANSNLFSRNK